MNYQQNHRDCQQWKAENLELSTTSNEAAKLFDYALDQLYCFYPDLETGGPIGATKKMLEADNNFAMARIMYVGLSGASCRNNKEIAEEVAVLQAIDDSSLTQRELLHRKAVIEWASEQKLDACQTWEEILLQYPKDTLALIMAIHNGFKNNGESRRQLDCISRILPYWNKSDFHYGYLLGYYAFGLEETNMIVEAEKVVKESLELIPNNSWAMHAYSHIFDSTCRSQEGIDFLNEQNFSDSNTLACHLYWHQTVNLTEIGEYEKALEIYDQKILPAAKKSGAFFNMDDGCQTLQRLEFEGVDVGIDRWNNLYTAYKSRIDDHERAYDDAHMLVSFVRSKAARDENMKDNYFKSLEGYMEGQHSSSNKDVTRDVLIPFSKGISKYSEGNFEEAVDCMLPVYKDIYRFGGSIAQRDFFHQFVVNSCIRSSLPKYQTIGRSLLNERKLHRPLSPLTDRMLAKLQQAH